MQSDVLAAERRRLAALVDDRIKRFEYDLGFTAPELWGERVDALRLGVACIFDEPTDEDDKP